MKKVIILVLSHDTWPFDMMEECIRKTWGSYKNPNVEIYYSHSGGDKFNVDENNNIFVPNTHGYHNIGYKTISAFEFLLTKDFDYLFRPNSSSFVNIPRLIEYVQTLPIEKFYAGSPIPYLHGGLNKNDHNDSAPHSCCSGCGYFLSRDLVQLIVDKKELWEHRLIDDLALCKFLKDNDVNMIENSRLKVHDVFDEQVYSFGNKLSKDQIMGEYHVTTRTSEILTNHPNPRENNCKIIKSLYKIVYEN
jgi:hypothetical protein